MSMGGGGGGGTQTAVTTASLPPELRGLATAYSNKAMALSNTPYQYYGGQRYAGLSGTQDMGIGMIQDRAINGDALQNTGYNYLGNMLTSGPQSATWNPYGGVSAGYNGMQVTADKNPYLGQNKYLQQNIDSALGDVARTYNQTVKPGQIGANVQSGSFGNSGLAEVQAMQENDLQKQMAGIASGMRMQDYQNQQQLAEADIGRRMAAQTTNLGTNEANLSRNMQAQQFNSQLGQDWASRNDAMYQNYMGNNLNALGLANTYGNQQYQDAAQLLNAGQIQQDQAQQGLDFNYQQFQEAQNNPYKQLAAMAGVFGSNLGSNSSTTTTGGGGGK